LPLSWIWITAAAVCLATVTVVSIRSASSARHAAFIFQRAQYEVAEALRTYPEVTATARQDAEAELAVAWTAFTERRYEEAIAAAKRAQHLAARIAGATTP